MVLNAALVVYLRAPPDFFCRRSVSRAIQCEGVTLFTGWEGMVVLLFPVQRPYVNLDLGEISSWFRSSLVISFVYCVFR